MRVLKMAGVCFGQDKETQFMSLLKELNILKAMDGKRNCNFAR